MSCVLVEEITAHSVPPNLRALLASLASPDLHAHIMAALYTLMLEAGFVPVGPDFPPAPAHNPGGFSAERLKAYGSCPPPGWDDKSCALHKCMFQLADFARHRCQLTVTDVCEVLTVNLTVEDYAGSGVREPVYTLRVLPWTHVKQTLDGGHEFRNTRKLSTEFKNAITWPVACGLYRRYGLAHASILGIPAEVTLKILHLLPAASVVAASGTCQTLRAVCNDDLLWEHMYKRDEIEPPHDGGHADVSFKAKYSKSVVWWGKVNKSTAPKCCSTRWRLPRTCRHRSEWPYNVHVPDKPWDWADM